MIEMKSQKIGGFTLIELCIVMIIMGLLVSNYLLFEQGRSAREHIRVSQENLAVVQYALAEYYNRNMRYPCPAPINEPSNAPGYARESKCSSSDLQNNNSGGLIFLAKSNDSSFSQSAGQANTSYFDGYQGVGGYIPTRTLGIADKYGDDGWGGKISYYISSDPSGVLDPSLDAPYSGSRLVIQDSFGQPLIEPPAIYVLIAHGRTGTGEIMPDGRPASCRAGTYDGENCDGDAVFTRESYSQGDNETFYDDILVHDRDVMYAGDSKLKRAMESLLECQRKGSFYDPDDKTADQYGCVMASITAGKCPEGFVMEGVDRDGVIECVPKMRVGHCKGGQFLLGYDASGQMICSDIVMKIQSCSQQGMIYSGVGSSGANEQGCVYARSGPPE